MPIYLFFSGAGTGKSRSASEFPNTLIQSLQDSENLALKNRIQNALVFNVSLENGTSFDKQSEPVNILAVGIRMLWQIYPQSNSVPMDFNRFLLTFDAPTPLEVLELINKSKKIDTSVILIVDGLQNFMTHHLRDGLDEGSAFYQALTKIGDLALNGSIFLIPCCTSTITSTFESSLKSTGRLRIPLPIVSLDPPKIDDIPVFQQDNDIVRLLVDDCEELSKY